MNLVLKLLASPWFWGDIFLSISGGIIVWWGLRVEKKAEKLLPPEDFKPDSDLYADVIKRQKHEIERGWRILMAISPRIKTAPCMSGLGAFQQQYFSQEPASLESSFGGRF